MHEILCVTQREGEQNTCTLVTFYRLGKVDLLTKPHMSLIVQFQVINLSEVCSLLARSNM